MFHQSKNLSIDIIKQENIKNFSAILSLIEEFENEHLSGIFTFFGKDNASLTEDEKAALKKAGLKSPIDLLNYIKTSIHELFALEKTRLENIGKTSEYYKSNNPEKLLTQEDLIKDSKESISKSAAYTIEVARNLWEILLNTGNNATYRSIVKKNSTYYNLLKLFNDIIDCLKSVFREAEHIAAKLDDFYEKYSEGKIFQLARSLNAKFILFSQSIDPIRGNTIGNCYGYVMEWKNQIIKNGKYLKFILNNEANIQQHYQSHSYDFRIDCSSSRAIFDAIDEMISKCNAQEIYRIYTHYNSNIRSHVLGLRKFSTGQIEFFDSNLGIFVFQDKALFRTWFNELLTRLFILKQAPLLTLKFTKIGIQPSNATPSIPLEPVSFDHDAKNRITDNLYNTKYFLKTATLQETNMKISNIKIDEIDHVMIATSHYDNDNILQIIKSLDDEISRLKEKTFDFSNERDNKIKALDELKLRFKNRSIHDTTKGIILTWLMDKPNESEKTHEAIIRTNHTNKEANTLTFQCVCNMMANYEINASGIEALQIDLLNHLFEIMQDMSQEQTLYQELILKNIAYCSLFSSTSSFAKLKSLCSTEINVQKFLSSVIEAFKSDQVSSSDRFFAKKKSTETSSKEDPLAKIFRNINLDDEKSLIQKINSIIEYKAGLRENVNFLGKILQETNRQIEFKKVFGKN